MPPGAHIAFGLLLASLAAPAFGAAVARAGLARANGGLLVLELARELVVGLGLGLVVSFAFRAAETAGRLVDVPRAEVLVPTSDERASPVARSTSCSRRSCSSRSAARHACSRRSSRATTRSRSPRAPRRAACARPPWSRRVGARPRGGSRARGARHCRTLADGSRARHNRARRAGGAVYFVGLPAKGLLAVGVMLLGIRALDHALTTDLLRWIELGRRWLVAWA